MTATSSGFHCCCFFSHFLYLCWFVSWAFFFFFLPKERNPVGWVGDKQHRRANFRFAFFPRREKIKGSGSGSSSIFRLRELVVCRGERPAVMYYVCTEAAPRSHTRPVLSTSPADSQPAPTLVAAPSKWRKRDLHLYPCGVGATLPAVTSEKPSSSSSRVPSCHWSEQCIMCQSWKPPEQHFFAAFWRYKGGLFVFFRSFFCIFLSFLTFAD